MKEYEVRKALLKRFSDHRQYAVAEEVQLTTGYSHRRIDMVVVDCFSSNSFRIDGIEIKVSKQDLRRELADPEKHVAFFDRIDYFSLACPADVLNGMTGLIPKNWGIITVSEDGQAKYRRKPLALHEDIDRTIPRGFLASLTRAIQKRQPYEQEIQDAYDRGREDAENERKRAFDYQREYVQRNYEAIQQYEAIRSRLQLWRDDKSVDEIINELEAFRSLEVDSVERSVRREANRLIELADKLNPKKQKGCEE